jgi:hypothetical protein
MNVHIGNLRANEDTAKRRFAEAEFHRTSGTVH